MTIISMVLGLVSIIDTALDKIVDGDLVVYNMKLHFDRYLKENKLNNVGKSYLINDEIEIWPKMIESLYEFLLRNNRYKEVVFGEKVVFKGDIKDYFKCIEFAEKENSLG